MILDIINVISGLETKPTLSNNFEADNNFTAVFQQAVETTTGKSGEQTNSPDNNFNGLLVSNSQNVGLGNLTGHRKVSLKDEIADSKRISATPSHKEKKENIVENNTFLGKEIQTYEELSNYTDANGVFAVDDNKTSDFNVLSYLANPLFYEELPLLYAQLEVVHTKSGINIYDLPAQGNMLGLGSTEAYVEIPMSEFKPIQLKTMQESTDTHSNNLQNSLLQVLDENGKEILKYGDQDISKNNIPAGKISLTDLPEEGFVIDNGQPLDTETFKILNSLKNNDVMKSNAGQQKTVIVENNSNVNVIKDVLQDVDQNVFQKGATVGKISVTGLTEENLVIDSSQPSDAETPKVSDALKNNASQQKTVIVENNPNVNVIKDVLQDVDQNVFQKGVTVGKISVTDLTEENLVIDSSQPSDTETPKVSDALKNNASQQKAVTVESQSNVIKETDTNSDIKNNVKLNNTNVIAEDKSFNNSAYLKTEQNVTESVDYKTGNIAAVNSSLTFDDILDDAAQPALSKSGVEVALQNSDEKDFDFNGIKLNLIKESEIKNQSDTDTDFETTQRNNEKQFSIEGLTEYALKKFFDHKNSEELFSQINNERKTFNADNEKQTFRVDTEKHSFVADNEKKFSYVNNGNNNIADNILKEIVKKVKMSENSDTQFIQLKSFEDAEIMLDITTVGKEKEVRILTADAFIKQALTDNSPLLQNLFNATKIKVDEIKLDKIVNVESKSEYSNLQSQSVKSIDLDDFAFSKQNDFVSSKSELETFFKKSINEKNTNTNFADSLQEFSKNLARNIQEFLKADPNDIPELVPAHKIIDTVVNRISQAVHEGKSEISVELAPANLGKLIVRILSEEGKLNAKIEVKNAEVKHVLEVGLARLKEELSQTGIKVEQIDVSLFKEDVSSGGHEKFFNQTKRKFDEDINLSLPDIEDEESIKSLGYNTLEYIV